jgi:hypothetical protein
MRRRWRWEARQHPVVHPEVRMQKKLYDFKKVENWSKRQGLCPLQHEYDQLASQLAPFLYHRTKYFDTAAVALQPVDRTVAIAGAGVYRASDLRGVMVLPTRHDGDRAEAYRLQAIHLAFRPDEKGQPSFQRCAHSIEGDLARRPLQRCPDFAARTAHADTVGAAIAGAVSLPTPLSGDLVLVPTELWADLVICTRKGGREHQTVVYRFPKAEFDRCVVPFDDGRFVREGDVRQGDTIIQVLDKALYGEARIDSRGANVLLNMPSDTLVVTACGRQRHDYFLRIAMDMLRRMIDAAEMDPAADGYPEIQSRSNVFPVLLGNLAGSCEQLLADSRFDLTPFAQAKLREGLGYGNGTNPWRLYLRARLPKGETFRVEQFVEQTDENYNLLKLSQGLVLTLPSCARVLPEVLNGVPINNGDPIADPVPRQAYQDHYGVLAAAGEANVSVIVEQLFQDVAVYPSRRVRVPDGVLLDRRYIPDELLGHVDDWYVDLRDVTRNSGGWLDAALGTYMGNLFIRQSAAEMQFDVNQVAYNATSTQPSRVSQYFRHTAKPKRQRATAR